MTQMNAIVFRAFGGPEVLERARVPKPEAQAGSAVVRVRAFGLNHAESYFRRGIWGDVPRTTGIECVGEVEDAGGGPLRKGQRVFALMGGMGRTIPGSYAEYVRVPLSNVVAIDSSLPWERLAALPESYATAWVVLTQNLAVSSGHRVLVRGGTSALGQAAVLMAQRLGATVLATTRSSGRAPLIEALGARALVEGPELVDQVRRDGAVDAVVDIVGATAVASSLATVRYQGRVAVVGFLGGGGPITLDPMTQMPSGAQLSFFASAFMFGTSEVPLARIPFQDFVAFAQRDERSRPAHVFTFDQLVEAHRLMDSGEARGKIVVTLPEA